jgi:hypothetical protein
VFPPEVIYRVDAEWFTDICRGNRELDAKWFTDICRGNTELDANSTCLLDNKMFCFKKVND